jgi:hypothetical protein
MIIDPAMCRCKWRSIKDIFRSDRVIEVALVNFAGEREPMTVESSRRLLIRRRMGVRPIGAHVVATLARKEKPEAARALLCTPGYMPHMLSRSRLNRRLHRLTDLFVMVFDL